MQPDEAIQAITRLVGYATTRWQERYLRNAPADLNPDIYSLELSLPSGAVRWIGDFNVFGWYRDLMIGSNAVVSALMAVEKWLYDGIDQGRDIDQWLEKLLYRSTSVAFAGVLTAVGIRTPKLLTGSLRPLLGSWHLHDWQQHLAPKEDVWRIGMVGWTRAGQRIYDQVVQWHAMAHRNVLLRDVAIQLLLTDQDTREFLNEQRKAWTAQQDQPTESVELLAARFNPENYSFTDLGDGRIQIEFQWPEHLREENARKVEAAQNSVRALAFPHRCRRILNRADQTSEPDSFWQEFQAIVDWKDDSGRQHKTMTHYEQEHDAIVIFDTKDAGTVAPLNSRPFITTTFTFTSAGGLSDFLALELRLAPTDRFKSESPRSDPNQHQATPPP